jgi:hypothetical protein
MLYDFTDSRPIPRCADCGAALGDYGRCEDCDDRTAESAPLNTDDTPLTAAWRAYKAGAMEWSDVQAIQASLMPRCADHNRPAAIFLSKRPACPACLDAAEGAA